MFDNTSEIEMQAQSPDTSPDLPSSVTPPRDSTAMPTLSASGLLEFVEKLVAGGRVDIYRHVIHEVDKHVVNAVMKYTGGVQSGAAQILGISRMTLRTKLLAIASSGSDEPNMTEQSSCHNRDKNTNGEVDHGTSDTPTEVTSRAKS